MIVWSNTAPSGRSYRDHLEGFGGAPPTFRQVVTEMGGAPVVTHPSLAFAFKFCGVAYTTSNEMEPNTARVGDTARKGGQLLRVTNL